MSHPGNAPEAVTQALTLDLVDAYGVSPVEAELEYDPTCPYAVTVRFVGGAAPVSWTFARDLLRLGRFQPVGEGDVHVRPELDQDGNAILVIELHSPYGAALLHAPARDVNEFVDRTATSVRPGTESSFMDLDATIAAVLVGAQAD